MKPLIIEGMQGLGDNLYQLSALRLLSRPVYVRTPWPQLYQGTGIHPLPRPSSLRTQDKNVSRSDLQWADPPADADRKTLHYVHRRKVSMVQALIDELGVSGRLDFSAPKFSAPNIKKPYIVVRPATVRSEWRADSRNPNPEYIAKAARAAMKRGYTVVSVADLEPGKEWAIDPLPPAHIRYHQGELPVEQLMGLVSEAVGLIGGVGWIAPAAVAYARHLLLIFSGWGADNGPRRIFDPRMNLSRVTQVIPDNFCMCRDRMHNCDKRISNYDAIVTDWLDGLPAVV